MNTTFRKQFNEEFSIEKYNQLIDSIAADFDYKPTFRIGETPFFIPNELKEQLLEGCNQVIDFIQKDGFKELKLSYDQILFVKSERNYIDIQTIDKKLTIRNTLDGFLKELDSSIFCKIVSCSANLP